MPGEDVYSWSTSASVNGNADALINWQEGQPRASVNNSARSMMAALAKAFAQITGSIVTTGTANAQLISSGNGYTTMPNNFYARIKIGSGLTNTGAATLMMDGLGSKPILTAAGAALAGGELPANGYVEVLYNGSNWVLLGSTSMVGGGGGGGGGAAPSSFAIWSVPGNYFYYPASTMTSIIVECIGGGGGGGGTSSVSGGPFGLASASGGGGGSGGYSRKLLTMADVGVKKPITLGAGGAGGPAQVGFAGGTTSFSTQCSALGGQGGSTDGNEGGAGGDIGTGDFNCTGAPGEAGSSVYYIQDVGGGYQFSRSGAGGPSVYGGGGAMPQRLSFGAYNGVIGRFGGGGSGGMSAASGATLPATSGGTGGHGLILITEWGGHGSFQTS